MAEKVLGKIEQAYFGFGGYQASQVGITIIISGRGWGTVYFKGCSNKDNYEDDYKKELVELIDEISELLKKANVASVEDLKKIPIECELENNTLKSFRILEEVL